MKILLLEEHASDAQTFSEAVAGVDADVELKTAHNVTELNKYLRQLDNGAADFMPDLIFLDAHLPDTETRQLIQHIHSTAHLKNLPVYMLTTSKAERDLLKSYNLSVQDLIVKPITGDKLSELINRFAVLR